ncbi:lipid IV(A) 3-deoxy-D-manno-octulosonic acid transferase [Vibrio scophthalmi]|uniref:lipid IV(A) 3-deoxy-D-manno-octulosonic acid transferase n=1 Tax=Vibrio scophthalmi TaxID=45658 RepID=UPI002FF1873F
MWIRLLYSVSLALAAPFLLFSLYKKKPGKPTFGKRWREHWGRTPKVEAKAPIWIHAVSVGESMAAIPLIQAIKKSHPNQAILVTTTTSTGAKQVEKLGDDVIHRYMPLDFSWCVRGFLRAVKPSQMLIIETELWPNTLFEVDKAGIPITVVNARLSERSCLRYQKFQLVFSSIAQHVSKFLCQYSSDADRFLRLGVENSKLHVTGSMKFDVNISKQSIQKGQELRKKLGNARPVWLAASTHEGEDEILLQAHNQLLKALPNAVLIVVPRHPERFDDVFKTIDKMGFKVVRRTSSSNWLKSDQVYLADTMGEMLLLLSAADLCFVGGSLLGEKVGGHNPLEPAALGLPILTGPSYYNFEEINKLLISHSGVSVCDTDKNIANAALKLFGNPSIRENIGQSNKKFVMENSGSINKILDIVIN